MKTEKFAASRFHPYLSQCRTGMKDIMTNTKEIAAKYHINQREFEEFVRSRNDIPYSDTIIGFLLWPENVEDAVDKYLLQKDPNNPRVLGKREDEKKRAETRKIQEEERKAQEIEKNRALFSMLITSGFSFDGYRIVEYSDFISADDVIQIGRGTANSFTNSTVTDVGESLKKSLSVIRSNALDKLKNIAYELGCNAVIGVDFDYITLEPETANLSGGKTYLPYVFCVTVNGNAV